MSHPASLGLGGPQPWAAVCISHKEVRNSESRWGDECQHQFEWEKNCHLFNDCKKNSKCTIQCKSSSNTHRKERGIKDFLKTSWRVNSSWLLLKKSIYNLVLLKMHTTLYSHIAECECQSVNGFMYVAKYSFCVFLGYFLEVNACGEQ